MGEGLTIQALACRRGHRVLFQGINAHTGPGGLLRVAGANGAGKTSLLRIICGLLSPWQGRVLWNGYDTRLRDEDFFRALVYVGHATATKDDLSVLENLTFSVSLQGQECSTASLYTALGDAGLGKRVNTPTRFLSQGQRRRLALARLALAANSRLWVLDEPVNALDTDAIEWLSSLILRHTNKGGVVAMSSHYELTLDPSIEQTELGL